MKRVAPFILLVVSVVASPSAWADFVVDLDGGGTHTRIQAAIDDAADGDTILVMPGEYVERIDFLGKAVRVTSSDPYDPQIVAATIINAQAAGRVVTLSSGEPGHAMLEGFTLTGGWDQMGGAILCANGARPIIRRNTMTVNFAAVHGGAIACTSGAAPIIEDNLIFENSCQGRGGGVYCESSSARVLGNEIRRNMAGCSSGGGVHVGAGADSVLVHRNLIIGNLSVYGAGITAEDASPRIEGNRIIGNSATTRGGGFAAVDAAPYVASNVLAGNRAPFGAALEYNQSSGTIRGNTIVDSRAEDAAVMLFINRSNVEFTGNVAAFQDRGVALVAVTGSVVSGEHNCLFGNVDGDASGTVTLSDTRAVDPGLTFRGRWLAGDGGPHPPCGGDDFVAILTGQGPINGDAEYRDSEDGRRFRVDIDDGPSGSFPVFINDEQVGQIFLDERGRGRMEYSDEDGNFPPDFPLIRQGDTARVGEIAEGVFDFDSDFRFVGLYAPGDEHLTDQSPLIDAYTLDGWPGRGDRDVDGQVRLAGDGIDIGADEWIEPGTGDADGDGDLDLGDFSVLQGCLADSQRMIDDPGCAPVDFDFDGTVDLADHERFIGLMTGPR